MPAANVDLADQLTQGFAAKFIRYKISRLLKRASIHRVDCDDLEQELKLLLVKRFAQFDPAIAHWNSFVVTVVERYLLTFLMNRRRRRLQQASLDEIAHRAIRSIEDSRTISFGRQQSGCKILDPTEQWDLVLDVQHLLARLPEEAHCLCQRLMNDNSLSEVARRMQVPRTTLRGHILVLRNGFTAAFEENRKKVSSLRHKSE